MGEIDLSAKFPELRPIRSAPGLGSINGCGFFLYGRRAFDEETQSFIQTYCFCIVFVPILALRAYRVAQTSSGKYILGREPLSTLAQTFNALILLAGLGLGGYGGWEAYTKSPAYQARRKLARADQLAAAGKLAEAARLCREVALGPGQNSTDAVRRVETMLEHPPANTAAQEEVGVIEMAKSLDRAGRWPQGSQGLYNRGMSLMNQCAGSDPRGAVAILDAVAPLAPKGEDLNPTRRDLLQKLVKAAPDDPEPASLLAAVHEAQGEEPRCASLLEPHRGRLGTLEGARILGLIDARQGRLEPALALLRPYTEARLKKFRAAEQTLLSTVQAAQQGVLERLNKERPDDFDVEGYARADKAGQQAILGRYLDGKLKNDPAIDDAEQGMIREASVVPVALELGMVLLQHAQGLKDPNARKAELDEAEKTFLAVSRQAGESDSYRLNLAQVYYWQGKQREGKALYDEVLKARNRDPKLLLTISELLRRAGSESEARPLAEEAFNKAKEQELTRHAAILRGLLAVELEDKILWLRRGNPTDPHTRALLGSYLAQQALEQGDEPAAIAQLREEVSLYASLPENASTLNNAALALFRLGSLTGEQGHYDRGLAMVEKANKLDPSDSVPMMNAGFLLMESSLRDVIGKSIDLALLKQGASRKLLGYLYRDHAGREKYVQRLRTHTGINRALGLLEKALVLAPRRAELYHTLNDLYHFRGDLDRLSALQQKLQSADLDLADRIAQAKDYISGKRDDQTRKERNAALARAEAVLKAARDKGRDATFAVAADELCELRMQGVSLGVPTDRDAILALAEEAHSAAPSQATRRGLVGALLFRAGGTLERSQPAYASLAARTRRSTSDLYLIAAVLGGEDAALRQAVEKHPDVQRAVDLMREYYKDDPTGAASGWAWAFIRPFHSEEAAGIARTYLNDQADQLSQSISRKLSPMTSAVALEAYWISSMAGNEAAGRSVLKEYASRGVPLPIDGR